MNSNFFDRCYEIARQIPFGRVTSYGAIAKQLGALKSARMVGYAIVFLLGIIWKRVNSTEILF